MTDRHSHSESHVSFASAGGHSHDGVNGTKIDWSAYSEDDLKGLITKVKRVIHVDSDVGHDDGELLPVGDVSPSSIVAAPTSLTLTSSSEFQNFQQVWIDASWSVPDGSIPDDDDETDIVDIENGDQAADETDAVDLDELEQQSVDDIVSYQVNQYKTSNGPAKGHISNTTDTTIRLGPFSPGVEHTVKVRAVNALGVKSAAITGSIITSYDDTIPGQVVGVTLTMGYRSAVLTWDESEDQDVINGGKYKIEVSTVSDFSTKRVFNTPATHFTISDLNTDIVHYFRVRAKDSNGNLGPWSDVVSNSSDPLPPSEVTDGEPPLTSPVPTVVGGPGYLFVRWTAVDNPDPVDYRVHISMASGFEPVESATSTNTLVSTVSGTSTMIRTLAGTSFAPLSYGITYYVKVVAHDADGYAPANTQGSAQMVQVGATDIGPNSISTGNIIAGTVLASDLAITTGLVADYLSSSNFQTGVRGWKIGYDGTAEFENLTARGSISAGPGGSLPEARLIFNNLGGRLEIDPGGNVTPALFKGSVSGSTAKTLITSPGTNLAQYASISLTTDVSDTSGLTNTISLSSDKMFIYGKREGVLLQKEPPQIDVNTWTTIPWTSADVQGGDWFNMLNSTNNYVYSRVNGTFLISASVDWAAASNGYRSIRLMKYVAATSSEVAVQMHVALYTPIVSGSPTSAEYHASPSIHLRMAEGDAVKLQVFGTKLSGTKMNLSDVRFSVFKVSS